MVACNEHSHKGVGLSQSSASYAEFVDSRKFTYSHLIEEEQEANSPLEKVYAP